MNLEEIRVLAKRTLEGPDERPQWLKDLEGGTDPREPYFHFMWLLAQTLKPKQSLEIGTRGGKTAMHLAHGNPDGFVLTVDINPGCKDEVARIAGEHGVQNVRGIFGDSLNVQLNWGIDGMSPVDLLFIDGAHTYEASYMDYLRFRSIVCNGGVIVFDDTRLDKDMNRAWNKIVDPKIELPELHYMGFGVAIKDASLEPLPL